MRTDRGERAEEGRVKGQTNSGQAAQLSIRLRQGYGATRCCAQLGGRGRAEGSKGKATGGTLFNMEGHGRDARATISEEEDRTALIKRGYRGEEARKTCFCETNRICF